MYTPVKPAVFWMLQPTPQTFLTLQTLLTSLHILLTLETRAASAHGILLDPPGRSSLWRDRRFPAGSVPTNHQDTQLFCGGFGVQYWQNNGKCGVCGDDYNHPKPRPNEAGGTYAQGIIVRTYQRGDVIAVTVKMTANHLGYYKFKLCPNNNVTLEATQECLDRHQLKVLQSSENGNRRVSERFVVGSELYGDHQVTLLLPPHLTCSQCVLQWTYTTGHSWGCDIDKDRRTRTCGIGRGNQEQFVNCADIAIVASGDPAKADNSAVDALIKTSHTTTTTITTTTTTTTTVGRKGVCRSTGSYAGQALVDAWCRIQCAVFYCPKTHCVCS